MNDETRNNIPDEVSELSLPETHFDRQSHTHHMVAGQTAQTNEIPEFLTGGILTPRKTNIAPTSEPVNTSTTQQQFTNGSTNTKKSKLRRKQFHSSSS